jgi:DNA-binding LytR/AlgR family response regulator
MVAARLEQSVFGTRAEWLRGVSIAAGAGLCLGVLGPFGSYLNPSRLTVVAYWVGVLLLGEVVFGLSVRPVRCLAPRWHVSPAAVAIVATLLVSLPLSALCRAVAMRLWPGPIGHTSALAWYGQTLVVAMLMVAVTEFAARRQRPLPVPVPDAMVKGGDFLSRLPVSLGRDLIALQMEDHYVRAHTQRGSALILIPLRQALEELSGVPGLRVHRSWWVAQRAVVDMVLDGRNLRLTLVNGLQAPVSRANVAAARGMGSAAP